MGRKASPYDFAGKTKLIKQLRRISGHTFGQDFLFPCRSRDFVPLELFQDVKGSIKAVKLSSARHVLPGEKKPHEIRASDRLDFPSKTPQGHPMNSGQKTAVAPFDFCVCVP